MRKRNLNRDDLFIRIGIDGGGGFLKIGLSVFELDETATIISARCKLSSGLTSKFKDSGVKRSFILALVPDVQENYRNVKLLWIKTGLNTMRHQFSIACDLKCATCCSVLWLMEANIPVVGVRQKREILETLVFLERCRC